MYFSLFLNVNLSQTDADWTEPNVFVLLLWLYIIGAVWDTQGRPTAPPPAPQIEPIKQRQHKRRGCGILDRYKISKESLDKRESSSSLAPSPRGRVKVYWQFVAKNRAYCNECWWWGCCENTFIYLPCVWTDQRRRTWRDLGRMWMWKKNTPLQVGVRWGVRGEVRGGVRGGVLHQEILFIVLFKLIINSQVLIVTIILSSSFMFSKWYLPVTPPIPKPPQGHL